MMIAPLRIRSERDLGARDHSHSGSPPDWLTVIPGLITLVVYHELPRSESKMGGSINQKYMYSLGVMTTDDRSILQLVSLEP